MRVTAYLTIRSVLLSLRIFSYRESDVSQKCPRVSAKSENSGTYVSLKMSGKNIEEFN